MDEVQHKMVKQFKMLGDFFSGHIFGNSILRFSSLRLIGKNMVSQCPKIGQ